MHPLSAAFAHCARHPTAQVVGLLAGPAGSDAGIATATHAIPLLHCAASVPGLEVCLDATGMWLDRSDLQPVGVYISLQPHLGWKKLLGVIAAWAGNDRGCKALQVAVVHPPGISGASGGREPDTASPLQRGWTFVPASASASSSLRRVFKLSGMPPTAADALPKAASFACCGTHVLEAACHAGAAGDRELDCEEALSAGHAWPAAL